MRAFLAIPLPPRLCDGLAEAGRSIPGLRAQKAPTIHLTIRFLGEIEDPEPVAAAAEAVAARHAAFDLWLRGLGAFPDPRRPRVVWVGLGEGEEQARSLARDIETALRPLGFPPEERPWTAHVTLGRFHGRPPRPLQIDPGRDFGRAKADRLVLYRSTLTPEGALHEPLREMSLRGGK